MEKQDFSLNVPENVQIAYKGNTVDIKPFITISEQIQLINNYISNYFLPDDNNVAMTRSDELNAEYALKLEVLDLCTSIEVDNNSMVVFYDELWNEIEIHIVNYNEFRGILYGIMSEIKREQSLEKSIGSVIDNFSTKLEFVLNKLSEYISDFKIEDIEKIKEAGLSLLKELEDSPVAEIFKEVEIGKIEKTLKKEKKEKVVPEEPKVE